MKEENNSEFLNKVDEFGKQMDAIIEAGTERRGLIIISSEYDTDKNGSHQIGFTMGNENEIIAALVGFINKPETRKLIIGALAVSIISSSSEKEAEHE
ncbi:hypothetical protein [Bacteroides sp.]|uniref:hypothetical protein n=1 Tax=Bacteroides sp. TaxID=29523 RepID=UPI002A7F94D8|nr:hypothetical protein [Bacteroides sp.]